MEVQVLEHEHPLKLVDWQLEFPHDDEDEEEDDDDVDDDVDDDDKEEEEEEEEEGFLDVCDRCCEDIHMYHRYYYKCARDSSCHFSVHKFCGELPSRLDDTSHPHPLLLVESDDYHTCTICKKSSMGEVCYKCFECHKFILDVKCGVQPERKTIHHPCHQHLLTCAISKPILCECSACGKRHEGIFYLCTICPGFTIHGDCAFLPEKLIIQQATEKVFSHRHPLTISYSFPKNDQQAKHYPRCRVCGESFSEGWYLWIYKCDKCMYYAHLDCAAPVRSIPPRENIKNFEDADHPHLLPLPFPDESYSIPKRLFFQETITKVNIKHMSHEHPLILVDINNNSSLLLMCHDPMKKTQLLCNGCLRPITSTMPFYKCDQNCDFVLHEWCTRLPTHIENHPCHPQHTLLLKYSHASPVFFNVFYCEVCLIPCNGFAYCCAICLYYVDVSCGFIPEKITHEAHPDHLLSIAQRPSSFKFCHICHKVCNGEVLFRCNTCDIYVDPRCALLLPKEIRHKHDKHPMRLSYLPIENHKSEYFCEICEEDLNPHESFYHCHDCVQSVHSACAPLILRCETETYNDDQRSIYYFINIKFGGILNTRKHPHPLSFAQGIVSYDKCSICDFTLQYRMIFKCLECNFAIGFACCGRLCEI